MRDDERVSVGDQVELFVEKGRIYKTLIDEITDKGLLYTAVPSYAGVLMPLRKGQRLKLAFYRETGRYVANVKVKSFKDSNDVRFATLEVTSKPIKEQRRNYYRLSVSLMAYMFAYPEEKAVRMTLDDNVFDEVLIEVARTNNLSVSGVSLITKNKYEIGERYLLKIYLEWPHETAPPLMVCGEIKRVNHNSTDDTYQIGFHFIDHKETVGEFISKFVQFQQQKQLRQKRLVHGD